MKTVLVTGGAGFIGSHICDRLIQLNYRVKCIDNLSNGSRDNIQHLIEHDNFHFHCMDINDLTADTLQDVDMICHQAAIGSVPKSIAMPEEYHKSNVTGFFHLINLAKNANIKRFVYASSSSVYGDDTTLPKQESKTGNALSPYAATKQMNESYANVFAKCYGMETIGLRYFNVFGPRQNPYGDYAAVIPKFILNALTGKVSTINGDGSFARDFTYIENVVNANVLALHTTDDNCFGTAFNIGAGGNTTILDLFHAIRMLSMQYVKMVDVVRHGPERKGDIPFSSADITKANKYLNYIPSIDIHEGLKNTIEYFNENKFDSAISE